ncbi:flagella basal body P-ring formation protein FlgA [Rhodosalinus sediminis]|uniref:Flagella basal body P-ring formation protein FlgA n=1 Tax=Rhodosalinus sediminis TaxID=1940533 RepID=A0A3D9BYA3_9RHOB|nr:flagellar basal body P-ring formation chaperone FlgA [Rhodosalinus sediminis]REC58341.1 flagella basal body P-ring formation protein FlgA [Rhodosalinus sediminis]
MTHRQRLRRAVAGAALLAAAAAQADTYADGIDGREMSALVSAALAEAGLTGRPAVAAARRFPGCDHRPRVSPRDGDWRTVEIACDRPRPWRRSLRSRADAAPRASSGAAPAPPAGAPVVVLAESLRRGTVLTAAHLETEPAPPGVDPTAVRDPARVAGRRLAVAVGAGRTLLARHLAPDWLVEADAPVVIAFDAGGVQVAVPGTALGPGRRGDLVEVRNAASGRTVRGRVTGRNAVEVVPKLR